MQPSVRILMATYNGEKFIKEQINSIINQTYTNWSLIIQDDGSKDRTAEIIKGFDDPRINIRESPEKMHGAYYNFHSIANQEKLSDMRYDYYMFCDQDDIWDSDKIEKMFLFLSKEDNNEPVFCYADMRIIDEKGKKQSSSICKSQGLEYVNRESLFFSHIIYGCNTMSNLYLSGMAGLPATLSVLRVVHLIPEYLHKLQSSHHYSQTALPCLHVHGAVYLSHKTPLPLRTPQA